MIGTSMYPISSITEEFKVSTNENEQPITPDETTSSPSSPIAGESKDLKPITAPTNLEDLNLQTSERVQDALKRILKALHICTHYQKCLGKPLPPTVDFFGKSLLGMTSILKFPGTLDYSVHCAENYINVSCLLYDKCFLA